MKPCLEYLELMNAVLDGEATEFESVRLQAHLDTCPACAALYEDLSALRAGSDALVVPAPAGLTDAVLAQIKAESKPQLTALPKKKKNRWFPMVAAAAVCALVVFSSGSLDRLISVGGGAAPAAAPQADMAAPMEAPAPAPSSMPVPAPSPMEMSPKDKEVYDHSTASENALTQDLQSTDTLTEPCEPEEFPAVPTVIPALTPEDARALVLDRIFGELYSEPGNTLMMDTTENITYITVENDDGTVEESVVTYTGPSPNRQYHCFTWTWEGQTEEDLDLFRYAVHMTDYYVMWPGQSPLFDEALTE